MEAAKVAAEAAEAAEAGAEAEAAEVAEAGAELDGARAESESEEVSVEMEVEVAEAGAEVEEAQAGVREAGGGKDAAPASRGGGAQTAAALASGSARRDERHVDIGAASSSITGAADEMRRCEIVRDRARYLAHVFGHARAQRMHMHLAAYATASLRTLVEGHAGSLCLLWLCSLSLVAMLIWPARLAL